MDRRSFDVAVAGAGVIGCATARALSDAGFRVAVIDPSAPGQGASGAAAGLLSPQYELEEPGPLFDLSDRSRALYPDFAGALGEETGIDVELRREGLLLLALTEEDDRALSAQHRWQKEADLSVERVDGDALRSLEPLATAEARWGLLLPQDMQVDNVKLCRALVRSLRDRGVTLIEGQSVLEVQREGARVEGVILSSGERLAAGRVLLAAGAWTATIRGMPRAIPLKPIRGQMLELEGGATPRRTLASPRGYVVPRLDGRMRVGSTMEDAGYVQRPTAGGVSSILRHALEVAPTLAASHVGSVWAGLRPGTPDGLPILGIDPELGGLFYATGHFRNGILLAPITAQLLAEIMTGSEPRPDLSAFRPDRFEKTRVPQSPST